MEYKDIEQVNKDMNTTDIKGKDYVEVNQRIKAFRKLYPEGTIETEILKLEGTMCVIKATVKINELVLGTGIAYENEGSTFINKTSYIENCETSAVGRALGMCGLGIDTSVASAEEVQNAIQNQEPTEEEANQLTISFGKYKGKLLKDLINEDMNYVKWMLNNKSNDYFKKCYELLTGEKLPTPEQQDERIKMIQEINELERELDVSHEDVLARLKVDSLNQLTDIQLVEVINNLKKVKK